MAQDAYITIARIIRPQGRHGEVAADLYTDFPERFEERRLVRVVSAAGVQRDLELQEFWPHKGRVILKFNRIDSIEDAEELRGYQVQIPREQRAQLEPGAYYVSDLVGCELMAAGKQIGEVAEVQFGAGAAPLLVIRQPVGELLIPFAQEYVVSVEVAARRLKMQLPEGLLEVNAPLTVEEKAQQKRPVVSSE